MPSKSPGMQQAGGDAIAFEDAFHGRTLLAVSLTSKVKPYKFGFAPYAPEIYRMPYAYCYRCAFKLEYPSCELHCAYSLKEFFNTYVPAEQVAALIVEPVLGEGGFVAPPREYFKVLKKICQDNGIIFIADEIQTGFGRTARMFAMEHYEVAPDIDHHGQIDGRGISSQRHYGKDRTHGPSPGRGVRRNLRRKSGLMSRSSCRP